MKSFKINLSMYEGKVRELISEAVQKKAFELGYEWRNSIDGVQCPGIEWLDFWSDGTITMCGYDAHCNGHMLITAADFLALTTEKDAPVFAPFDKVLVRDKDDEAWKCDLFSHMNGRAFYCVGTYWSQCIHYEGNERLRGTTDEPNS